MFEIAKRQEKAAQKDVTTEIKKIKAKSFTKMRLI